MPQWDLREVMGSSRNYIIVPFTTTTNEGIFQYNTSNKMDELWCLLCVTIIHSSPRTQIIYINKQVVELHYMSFDCIVCFGRVQYQE